MRLESVGIQPVGKKDLRHELVKYMEQNAIVTEGLHYQDFLLELYHEDLDIPIADTEMPDEKDHQISAVEGSDT